MAIVSLEIISFAEIFAPLLKKKKKRMNQLAITNSIKISVISITKLLPSYQTRRPLTLSTEHLRYASIVEDEI